MVTLQFLAENLRSPTGCVSDRLMPNAVWGWLICRFLNVQVAFCRVADVYVPFEAKFMVAFWLGIRKLSVGVNSMCAVWACTGMMMLQIISDIVTIMAVVVKAVFVGIITL